ncbi:MAG TPA: GatB/YqeY domain-containing protein [Isosphaeraceae bacterium]|nr:GatB/YqeY domain-containing protein [Isosphaeraceae bacterium]
MSTSPSIVQRMRRQLPEAMKARDTVRTNFLRYWIAQLTLGTGAEMSDTEAIKKMRGVLKEAKSGLTTFSPEELELIRAWVPPTLSPEQITAALAPLADQIQAAPKDGMAMGIAMKALAGQAVDSDDVKVVIGALRSPLASARPSE